MKIVLIFIILAFNGIILFAAETSTEIPRNFQGQWASNIKNCSIDHIYNLTIYPNSVDFWESGGYALSIVIQDKNELALIIDFSGEGDKWIGFVHFQISSDEKSLKDISDPYSRNQLVRHRCPY